MLISLSLSLSLQRSQSSVEKWNVCRVRLQASRHNIIFHAGMAQYKIYSGIWEEGDRWGGGRDEGGRERGGGGRAIYWLWNFWLFEIKRSANGLTLFFCTDKFFRQCIQNQPAAPPSQLFFFAFQLRHAEHWRGPALDGQQHPRGEGLRLLRRERWLRHWERGQCASDIRPPNSVRSTVSLHSFNLHHCIKENKMSRWFASPAKQYFCEQIDVWKLLDFD